MRLYCGIDLHSNNSMISLIDEADRVVSEKRLDNKLETIEHHLQPFQDDISGVVVESTYNWYWLVDGLMEKGYPADQKGQTRLKIDKKSCGFLDRF